MEVGHPVRELLQVPLELLLLRPHLFLQQGAVLLQQLRRLLLLQLEAERPVEGLPPRREVLARDVKLQREGGGGEVEVAVVEVEVDVAVAAAAARHLRLLQ